MRIKNLDVGVERVTQWNVGDDIHLPAEGRTAPAFLPQYRALDQVLRRPSLDERLPDLLEPADLDPGLLEPGRLAEVRQQVQALFSERAARARGKAAGAFAAAADLLDADEALSDEVRAALALLLRA